ncbi:MAG: M50 family metallopeptidase [Verrucomicrobiota bacterium]
MALPHRDPAPEKTPEGWEKWTTTIVGGVFIGLISAEIMIDYEPRKLGALFLLLAWGPLLFLHEAGHAIVAHWCGWNVERVVLGFGHRMKRFTIGRTVVDVRAIPIEGFVLPTPRDLKSPRLRSTLIYAAGPVAEAVLLVLIIIMVGWDTLLTSTDHPGMIAVQATCVAIVMGLIFNLIPHTTQTGGGHSWNDGMGILWSHRLPDEYFRSLIEGATQRNDVEKEPD